MKAEIDYTLYLVADEQYCHPYTLTEVIMKAVLGGVTMIQYRNKNASIADMHQQVTLIQRVLANSQVPLIINDHLEIAVAIDADGVHLGQDDGCVTKARELLGPDKIVGLSVRNEQELIAAQELPIDYLGFGPVFTTKSKNDASKPIGLRALEQAVQHSSKPIVAIGGINLENITHVYATGVAGAAVISAICSHPMPERAASMLKKEKQNGAS